MSSEKSRLSYTACIVILCLVALYKRGSQLVAPQDAAFYQHCLARAGNSSLLIKLLSPFPGLVAGLVELFFAKGMVKHYAFRKATLRRLIEEAYASGAKQCVILGGGFDICAYRMAAQHEDLHVYEIDRPFMHSLKIQALQEAYGALPGNFTGMGADLATSRLTDVLASAGGFDAGKKTAFVSEGVIMYLSEASVADLLAQIRKLGPSGSQFIFTAMTRKKVSQGFKRHISNVFLFLFGEAFTFALEPQAMPAFLGNHQFTASYVSDVECGEYVVSAVVL